MSNELNILDAVAQYRLDRRSSQRERLFQLLAMKPNDELVSELDQLLVSLGVNLETGAKLAKADAYLKQRIAERDAARKRAEEAAPLLVAARDKWKKFSDAYRKEHGRDVDLKRGVAHPPPASVKARALADEVERLQRETDCHAAERFVQRATDELEKLEGVYRDPDPGQPEGSAIFTGITRTDAPGMAGIDCLLSPPRMT